VHYDSLCCGAGNHTCLRLSREPANKETKVHKSSIWVLLSHKAGTLGEICSLIGAIKCNIFNVDLVDKKEDFLSFISKNARKYYEDNLSPHSRVNKTLEILKL
jgi:hypothetical protein